MTDTVLQAGPISPDDIVEITRTVWSSFLQLDLAVVPPEEAPLPGRVLSAALRLSGAWSGAVLLQCPEGHAAAAAAAMFAREPAQLSDGDARDAVGELANIVAGNIKSLLPAPCELSLPSVGWDGLASAGPSGAGLLHRVAFVATAGVLHVSVWKG